MAPIGARPAGSGDDRRLAGVSHVADVHSTRRLSLGVVRMANRATTMTTTDEARAALLLTIRHGHVNKAEADVDTLIAAVRAESEGWLSPDELARDGWQKVGPDELVVKPAPYRELIEQAVRAESAETLAAMREAAEQVYAAMDAACRWAAGEIAGVKTTQDADRHMAGYDALLDATVSLGQTLGILSGAALATTPAEEEAEDRLLDNAAIEAEARAAALDEARAAVDDSVDLPEALDRIDALREGADKV